MGKLKILLILMCLSAALILFPAAADFSAEADGYDFSQVGESALPDGFDTANLWYDAAAYLDIASLRAIVKDWASSGKLPDPTLPDFEPIIVTAIDTGISLGHELFEGLYVYDDEGQRLTYDGYRKIESPDAAEDAEDHGTHVNGSIAILIKELGLQDFIKILPARAVSTVTYYEGGYAEHTFNPTHIVNAMVWAESHGADVITMSLGSGGAISGGIWNGGYMKQTMERLTNTAIVLGAAGNDGKVSSEFEHYPSLCEGFVSVMAYTQGTSPRRLAGFSNYGDYDIASPGTSIWSATDYSEDSGLSHYDYKQGTSMATPIAAAAAALLQLRYQYVEEVDCSARILSEIFKNHSDKTIQNHASAGAIEPVKMLDAVKLLSEDFELSEFYPAPEALNVSVSGLLNQNLGNKSPITFKASVLPLAADPALSVKWYVDGEEAASGSVFTYTPETQRTSEVYAVLGDDILQSRTFTVSLNYQKVLVSECSLALAAGRAVAGKDATVTLSGGEYADPATISWKVDGVPFAQNTASINLENLKAGVYLIEVTVGGNSREFEFVVGLDYPLIIGLSSAGGALVLAAVILTIVLIKRKQKALSSSDAGGVSE
ncbi:MAG: S8 family serine peptidase [Christensenellales bacterium]|jgi:subtilisin family serine protease|nr:S8 family serine peptidase [Eubacteriales bacterium]